MKNPKSNTLVICQITVSSIPLLFSPLNYNFYQTFCVRVKSSFVSFLHSQVKLQLQESIHIQKGRCLTTLKVSEAPLGIAFLLAPNLSLELLNPLLSKSPSFLFKKKKNFHQKSVKLSQPGEEREKKAR